MITVVTHKSDTTNSDTLFAQTRMSLFGGVCEELQKKVSLIFLIEAINTHSLLFLQNFVIQERRKGFLIK